MKFKLNALNIQFRNSREIIDLTAQVTFFHGQIATGKSTIARLIDYCLGGGLQKTPALSQELVSVHLNLTIGEFEVLLEREGLSSNTIRVTWTDQHGKSAALSAPMQAGERPIWGDLVYNFSDLLFHLSGITPIRVRKSKRDQTSQLVRLSFRDLMWYCYLEQDYLDSSFFRLEDDSRKYKSRDVMRFVVGFYTELINDLESDLEKTTSDRKTKEEAAKQIRAFLAELGYDSDMTIRAQMGRVQEELVAARAEIVRLREGQSAGTHFVDNLREELRTLGTLLETERQAIVDLSIRIADQEQLRAELITAKFKLSRALSATTVLEGAEFALCPNCGTATSQLARSADQCLLCGTHDVDQPQGGTTPEFVNRDIDSRIDDLEQSLKQHRKEYAKQERRVSDLTSKKNEFDQRLTDELRTYDSAFLANTRAAERLAASLEEQLRNLQRISRMPETLDELDKEVASLSVKEKRIRENIASEKRKLKSAEEVVRDLEETYLAILLAVGVPGIDKSDVVYIDRLTWIPTIFPKGDDGFGYDFFSAGSGGKKTLLNVCYALALHKVASDRDLPLPSLLIIDSPMKNIGKDVNRETFLALYEVLYGLAKDSLSATQFVIIDNEFPPVPLGLGVIDRYMPPPLIPGYEGP